VRINKLDTDQQAPGAGVLERMAMVVSDINPRINPFTIIHMFKFKDTNTAICCTCREKLNV
jgi:hypothetical protein